MKIIPTRVGTSTEFFAFQGGLDLVSPALRLPAGAVIASQNYEPTTEGGYARCKGYERFDGRPSPSAAPSGLTGALTPAEEAQGLVDAADVRRALIQPPHGLWSYPWRVLLRWRHVRIPRQRRRNCWRYVEGVCWRLGFCGAQ